MSYAAIGGTAVNAGINAQVTYTAEGAEVNAVSVTPSNIAYVHISVPSPANAVDKLNNYWVLCSGDQTNAFANSITINYGDQHVETKPLHKAYADIKEDANNNASDFDVHMSLPLGINVTLELQFGDTKTPFKINSVSLGFMAP